MRSTTHGVLRLASLVGWLLGRRGDYDEYTPAHLAPSEVMNRPMQDRPRRFYANFMNHMGSGGEMGRSSPWVAMRIHGLGIQPQVYGRRGGKKGEEAAWHSAWEGIRQHTRSGIWEPKHACNAPSSAAGAATAENG